MLPFRSQLRRLLLLLAGLACVAPAAVRAQETTRVTLDQALERMAENNPALRLARTGAAEMQALVRQAGAYPNPTAILTHEPVWRAGDRYRESYFNLSQRLEWAGARRARIKEARSLAMASRLGLGADSLEAAHKVGLVFLEAAAAEQRLEALMDVAAVFRGADEAMQRRVDAGEASGYSHRRLSVEHARYKLQQARTRVEMYNARRALTVLIMPHAGEGLMAPAAVDWSVPDAENVASHLSAALKSRPEVAVARLEQEAAEAGLLGARLASRPAPTVTAGYKAQSDGFDGVLLGLSAQIPLLDRNRGNTEAARMRLLSAQTEAQVLAFTIEMEVRQAYETFAAMNQAHDLIARHILEDSDALMEAAEAAYLEGEMSLLELLDAAGAYYAQRELVIELNLDRKRAYLDLLRATGRAPHSDPQK